MNQDPMKEWVLRDELLAAFHRWPIIILFALVGSLLGLVFAYLWPASYRASLQLSVELNPYRVLEDQYIPEFAGAEFRNIDDYKHWQMLQLSMVVRSDAYIQETLNRLQEKDTAWSSVSLQDLQEMLSANWRNAGQWRLTAYGSSAQQAVEAVETWSEVVLEFTEESIANSRDLFRLELVLRSLNDELVTTQLQGEVLEEVRAELDENLDILISLPGDQVLSETDHLGLLSIANQLNVTLTGRESQINSFPTEGAPMSDYLSWFKSAKMLLEEELVIIEMRKSEIEDQMSSVETEWEESLVKANGLSATLNLENPQSGNTQFEELHSYSLAALVGVSLGLLAWILLFLVQISRQGYR